MSLPDSSAGNSDSERRPSTPSGQMKEIPGTMFVVVEVDGVQTVMDHDTYDYGQREGSLDEPAQHDLDGLPITRIRALSGGMFRGQALPSAILLDTSEPDSITAFRQCCAIVDGAGAGHCGCLGGPTLELFAASDLVATIGMQHGRGIRWARWRDDARLLNGEALTSWLTDHGVHPDLLDLLYHNPLPLEGGQADGWGPVALSLADQRVLLAEIQFRQNKVEAAAAAC